MTKWLVLTLSLSLSLIAAENRPCEQSEGAVMNYERVLLTAVAEKNPAAMARPLACLLEVQEKGEGMARVYAASALRPLLGGEQLPGIVKDRRYSQANQLLEHMTKKASDPVLDSVVSQYAKGDWTFYKLFCEEGNTEFCADFLPDEKKVRAESPLLAAAAMLRLKKAYDVLDGKQREEVAQRIKNLYRDIPRSAEIQRKFIDQIYTEIFGRELSWA